MICSVNAGAMTVRACMCVLYWAMAGVKQFDEQETLGGILDVFWRRGWERTSMSDLAQATGVQRGSLYHAYGGKEELFLLAFAIYADKFLAQARAALQGATAEEALRRFLDVTVSNMARGRPARGCLTTRTAIESDGVGPRIRARLRRLIDDLRTVITDALSQPHLRASLALEPEEAAEMLVTFTRGLAVMGRIYKDAGPLRKNADTLVRLMAGGRMDVSGRVTNNGAHAPPQPAHRPGPAGRRPRALP